MALEIDFHQILTDNFTVNVQNCAPDFDNIEVAIDLTVTGLLDLQNGKVVIDSGATLSLTSSASVSGGSAASYIAGAFQRIRTTAFRLPVATGIACEYYPLPNLKSLNFSNQPKISLNLSFMNTPQF